MREKIMKALQKYHRVQGIAFLSEQDAIDYYKGLIEIIEKLIYENHD